MVERKPHALLRPHAVIYRFLKQTDPVLTDLSDTARSLGEVLGKTGAMPAEKLEHLQRDIMPLEDYVAKFNGYFADALTVEKAKSGLQPDEDELGF